MKLRIHHIFDMIRDMGKTAEIQRHPYGHSYHIIARRIAKGDFTAITLAVENDEVCEGCSQLRGKTCVDTISHRRDYSRKEEFNNYLDRRILSLVGLKEGDRLSHKEILAAAEVYADNIEFLYRGNDAAHTRLRKEHFLKGLAILRSRDGYA